MKTLETRKDKAQNSARYWQRVLNLTSFNISVEFVDFDRKDFVQSGDIKIDLKKKKAKILLTDENNNNDSYTILHELVHLMLWNYDSFCENKLFDKDKSKYFTLLEKTVADITNVFYHHFK